MQKENNLVTVDARDNIKYKEDQICIRNSVYNK